jgi:CheY-like chemotaxis protein
MPLANRAPLLLHALEGFTSEDAALILGTEVGTVEARIDEAFQELDRQPKADVLIIEDEPIIAMDLETIVRDQGHNVVGVAVTRRDAVERFRERKPGLVLADIQLADDSSGIDAVRDILAERSVPVIFVTAFPERLLTGDRVEPTFLITKPFQRNTVKAAIGQALLETMTAVPDDPEVPEREPQAAPALMAEHLVSPRPSPVDAEVRAGQLRLRDDAKADTFTDASSLDALRRLHLATATRLCSSLAGSNVGPGFNARLLSVRRILSRRLTRERSLQLAIQTRGLEGMMAAVSERLDDVTAADVGGFVSDLADTVRQFPNYREFLNEAQSFDAIPEATGEAASQLASLLENQPNEIVAPDLRSAIGEVREVAQEHSDAVSRLALIRTVGNAFRAIGRALNRRLRGVGRKAAETFDDIVGKALGRGLAYLVVGAASAGLLGVLASTFPSEFAFLHWIVRLAQGVVR